MSKNDRMRPTTFYSLTILIFYSEFIEIELIVFIFLNVIMHKCYDFTHFVLI